MIEFVHDVGFFFNSEDIAASLIDESDCRSGVGLSSVDQNNLVNANQWSQNSLDQKVVSVIFWLDWENECYFSNLDE